MNIEEWAIERAIASGRCEGLMAAYDALKDRLEPLDRIMLLEMSTAALKNKQEQ